MKDEILEERMDRLLESWRLEKQDRRNRVLAERLKIPRTREEMLAELFSLGGLNAPQRRGAPAGEQFPQKVAVIV